jgi:hypothetical protein
VISKLQPLFDIDYHLVFQGLQILAWFTAIILCTAC